MQRWEENKETLSRCLGAMSSIDKNRATIDPEPAFALWTELTCIVRESRRTVYLIGNGASASMSSHIAADLAKNAYVHTEVFSDLSLITAIGNDMGYHEVFAEPLRRRMQPGDMLVAISSSGESENVINAARVTEELGGHIITLSAMNPNNRLRSMGMINFYVPATTYGTAETCHSAILHHWMDRMAIQPTYDIGLNIPSPMVSQSEREIS